MTETNTHAADPNDVVGADVFAAARWFAELDNSTARAVTRDEIEWQCTTWGSGRGCANWAETATFSLVAQVFGLPSGRNFDARDELVVCVPLDRFPEIARLIRRLGEDPERWPWLDEEDQDRQIALAAQVLGTTAAAVADDDDLLWALRIE